MARGRRATLPSSPPRYLPFWQAMSPRDQGRDRVASRAPTVPPTAHQTPSDTMMGGKSNQVWVCRRLAPTRGFDALPLPSARPRKSVVSGDRILTPSSSMLPMRRDSRHRCNRHSHYSSNSNNREEQASFMLVEALLRNDRAQVLRHCLRHWHLRPPILNHTTI